MQRQYDAAVTWASGQGDVNQGYTRGNLRAMVDKGMLNMRDMRIIWTSEPIVNGPHTARTDLPAAFKEDWKRFHLALPTAHPEIYRQVERGGGHRLPRGAARGLRADRRDPPRGSRRAPPPDVTRGSLPTPPASPR